MNTRPSFYQLSCIVFIHFSSASESMSFSGAFPTTAIDTVCVRVYTPKSYRQLQVKDLLKVPVYVAARARFEPTTIWSKGIVSTNAPPIGVDSGGARARAPNN